MEASGGANCGSVRPILLYGSLARGVKINAPEVRRGRQKLHPNPDPFCPALPGKYDPALLLFLSLRVNQHQHFVVIHFVLQHQQAAVRVHHQCLAHLAELLAGVAAAEGLQLHAVKDALAAPVCRERGFLHNVPIIGPAPGTVNCPFGQVCPISTLFAEQLVSPNRLALEWLGGYGSMPGANLYQTAVALFFIIFVQSLIGTERLSLRLGASYEPC